MAKTKGCQYFHHRSFVTPYFDNFTQIDGNYSQVVVIKGPKIVPALNFDIPKAQTFNFEPRLRAASEPNQKL